MSDLEQHAVGDAQPTMATHTGGTPKSEEVLARVMRMLGADHVSAVRRSPGHHTVDVVARVGRPFVSAGVSLPLDATDLVERALAGFTCGLALEDAETPLEALAYATGLATAIALPVQAPPDDTVVGAVLMAWDDLAASTETVEWAIDEEQAALVALLHPAGASAKRLVVAHDDPMIAHGLSGLAAERLDADVAICRSLADLVGLLGGSRADAVLCDERLDGHALTDVAYQLRASGIAAPLIAVTRTQTSSSICAALHAGVTGYLAVTDDAEHIATVIGDVLDGRMHLPPAPVEPAPRALTAREEQVLWALDRGLTDFQIARELGVSLSTVKTHARRLFRKLEVGTRTAAVHRARVEGLLQ